MSEIKQQKKLMLLGGLRYLIPIIEAAHEMGLYVITVDYLPDNIAHRYSDEYHNVSIKDKEAILALAKDLKIDGIMSFAVDPGVVTAAYVAEKMGLPFQGSYESVKILQDKSLFRRFLRNNNFNVPNAKGYSNIEEALNDISFFNWPVIVKPVDSAGSKGVSKVETPDVLEEAIEYALSESHNGNFIIEDFLEKEGNSSDTDCFSIDGNLCYCSFSNQFFDENADNPYTPAAYSWPSDMPMEVQKELQSELQRLITLLNLNSGVYNVETRLCKNGKPYIMEFTPRGGGNRLSEMLDIASNSNLIENSVKAAMGMPLSPMKNPEYNGHFAEIILHADREGIFEKLEISEDLKSYVKQIDLWIETGNKVDKFSGANNALGTLVLCFPDKKKLDEIILDISNYISIIIK